MQQWMLPSRNSKLALQKIYSTAKFVLDTARWREQANFFLNIFRNFCLNIAQRQTSIGCYFNSCINKHKDSTSPHGAHSTTRKINLDGNRDRKTDVLYFNNSKKCFMQPDQQSPMGCFYSVDLSRRLSEKISFRNITYQCTVTAQLLRRIILHQTNKISTRRESH